MTTVTDLLIAQTTADRLKDFVNAASRPAPFFILSCVGLGIFLSGYRFFTRPRVALSIAALTVVFFVASAFDPDFLAIIKKADNVPILMMSLAVGFVLWLALRQASINDRNIEEGKPLIEAGADDKVLVWPDLVFIELIALIICTAILVIWSVVLPAPLEQPADPNVAPNPAKAPWYFLGLQELLVYFDPWIAGVLLPGLILVGLGAIPYLDRNPRGNGYYTFKERPFAISMFLGGFVILWVVLIVFGTFLRGPNWNFFGPYEYWDPHRPAALLNVDLRDLFWIQLLGTSLPKENLWGIPYYLVREAPGIVLVLFYFLGLPFVLKRLVFRALYDRMGPLRFHLMLQLLLWMAMVPIKMVLRWTLNLHYIVAITELFFNI